jgi:hypothetical protein
MKSLCYNQLMAAKYDIKKEPQHIQQFAEYKQSLGKD